MKWVMARRERSPGALQAEVAGMQPPCALPSDPQP
jgi:hypothetical protein